MSVVSVIRLIIWIACLVANIKVAEQKNRSVVKWVILSVFFSWIALIINYAAKPNTKRQ